jgi:hypothetical protein
VGVKTLFTYDGIGRVVTVTTDYQGSSAMRYELTYDPVLPAQITEITPRNPTTGQRKADWEAWKFDYYPPGSPAPGAVHHVFRVRADGVTLDSLTTMEYDGRGLLTAKIDAATICTTQREI